MSNVKAKNQQRDNWKAYEKSLYWKVWESLEELRERYVKHSNQYKKLNDALDALMDFKFGGNGRGGR